MNLLQIMVFHVALMFKRRNVEENQKVKKGRNIEMKVSHDWQERIKPLKNT